MPPARRHRPPLIAAALLGAACSRGGLPAAAEGPPQRIVAASVASAEVLCAIAPPQQLAGVHFLAVDPRFSLATAAASELPRLGAEPEQLLSVRPDLVILDAYTKPETTALLSSAGVRTVQLAAASDFAGVVANIRDLGRWCGSSERAEQLVAGMQRDLARLATVSPTVRDFRLLSLDGALHTYGRGSLFDAVVQTAGARNLAAERGVGPFRKLDLEAVLTWRPDVLVLGVEPGGEEAERRRLRQDPGLRLLPCVQRDRLLFVPGALLATTSHHVVELALHVQQRLCEWGRP